MKAVIINIGDELLKGILLNSNLLELSRILLQRGIIVKKNVVLPDNINVIADEVKHYIDNIDLLVISGGLGPTHDDVTKEAISLALNLELTYSENIYASLREKFKKYNIPETENLRKYALIPQGCELLENPVGIAPGFKIPFKKTTILLLPGPPFEAKEILFRFFEKFETAEFHWNYIRTFGLKENEILEKCEKELKYVDSGLYPDIRGVDIFLSSSDSGLIEEISKSIISKLGKNIYSIGFKNIEEIIGEKLRKKKLTLATAESCTGGLLGNLITNVTGSSDYFMGGIVSYSNEAKMKLLQVPEEVFKKYGAVSRECAFHMVTNVRTIFNTSFGISITGIAGPTGGTPEKPVGLVYIGIAESKATYVFQRNFGGTRTEVKMKSALESLYLLNLILDGHTFPKNVLKL